MLQPHTCRVFFRKSLAAFTLIELLVVVAVIATLIAMLMPMIEAIRTSARSVVCMSNMRQYSHAFAYYATDNSGFIPGNQMHGWRSQGRTGTHNFYGFLEPWMDATSNVYMCPDGNFSRKQWDTLRTSESATVSLHGQTLKLFQGFDNGNQFVSKLELNWLEAFSTQYTMNSYLYRKFLTANHKWDDYTDTANPQPFSDSFHMKLCAPNPSQTMLIGEVQMVSMIAPGNSTGQIWGVPEFYWDFGDATEMRSQVQYSKKSAPEIGFYNAHAPRATHRGRGSFLYFDLHVEQRDPMDLAPNGMGNTPNGYRARY